MNDDKNLIENPMICINNASLSDKTKSWPYFSSGVIVLCKLIQELEEQKYGTKMVSLFQKNS
jgi:hypothetical protein